MGLLVFIFLLICGVFNCHSFPTQNTKTLHSEEFELLNVRLDKVAKTFTDELKEKDLQIVKLKHGMTELRKELNGLETKLSYSTVSFAAIKNDESVVPDGRITFNEELEDDGNNFDADQGIFRAPVTGTYSFLFNGNSYGNIKEEMDVDVVVNGKVVQNFHDIEDEGQYRQITLFFSIQLNANDELYLNNYISGGLRADAVHFISFSGYLVGFDQI